MRYTEQAMQGPGGATSPESPAPRESLTSVNEEIAKTLAQSSEFLSKILVSIRGSQPEAQGNVAKMPERTLIGDVHGIRALAYEIQSKIQEVGSIL